MSFSRSPALGTIRFTRADYDRARERYKPDRVSLLFVAESPPSSGGYFCFNKTIGKDHLFRETMKSLKLWPISRPMGKGIDKRQFLEEFYSRGFFLIDTCQLPVDNLSARERKTAIHRAAPELARRVKRLSPRHVLIVKKTVFDPVQKALKRAGLGDKVLNNKHLPFPSHGNQKRYRVMLRRLMKKHERPKKIGRGRL